MQKNRFNIEDDKKAGIHRVSVPLINSGITYLCTIVILSSFWILHFYQMYIRYILGAGGQHFYLSIC
jgi:hypothetical protein